MSEINRRGLFGVLVTMFGVIVGWFTGTRTSSGQINVGDIFRRYPFGIPKYGFEGWSFGKEKNVRLKDPNTGHEFPDLGFLTQRQIDILIKNGIVGFQAFVRDEDRLEFSDYGQGLELRFEKIAEHWQDERLTAADLLRYPDLLYYTQDRLLGLEWKRYVFGLCPYNFDTPMSEVRSGIRISQRQAKKARERHGITDHFSYLKTHISDSTCWKGKPVIYVTLVDIWFCEQGKKER